MKDDVSPSLDECINIQRKLPESCAWIYKGYFLESYSYEYKDGFFNQWVTAERLKLYLHARNIHLDVTGRTAKSDFDNRTTWIELKDATYSISLNYGKSILVSFKKKDMNHCIKEINQIETLEVLEDFFICGYEPEDKDYFESFVRKYTPVKITLSEYFSGYHDEDNYQVDLYNIDNQHFTSRGGRTYGNMTEMSMCEALAGVKFPAVYVYDKTEIVKINAYSKDNGELSYRWIGGYDGVVLSHTPYAKLKDSGWYSVVVTNTIIGKNSGLIRSASYEYRDKFFITSKNIKFWKRKLRSSKKRKLHRELYM